MTETKYPIEIVEIAEQFITNNEKYVKTIIPVYNRGFIVVIMDENETTFKPYIQIGTFGKDFIKLYKTIKNFYNYDEAIIALITFKNLGEGLHSRTYLDIYCNKMGVTTHSNSINPNF